MLLLLVVLSGLSFGPLDAAPGSALDDVSWFLTATVVVGWFLTATVVVGYWTVYLRWMRTVRGP